VRDRAVYRACVFKALTCEPPTILIPCHGDIVTQPGLAERLRQLVEARI
jgi:hypothetical protein